MGDDSAADPEKTFVHIQNNEYSMDEDLIEEVLPCSCLPPPEHREISPSIACGDQASCINRTLQIECAPSECPSGISCQNQLFQRCKYTPAEIFKTHGKGLGLRCTENVKAGRFIIEYVGEVVTRKQMDARIASRTDNSSPHFYFMTLHNDKIIDATHKGNLSRFMNHSCNPNCETQKWIVNGRLRIGIFALKSIRAGTELCFDYKFIRFGNNAQACLCGEAGYCKGLIGTSKGKDEDNYSVENAEDAAGMINVLLRSKDEKAALSLLQSFSQTKDSTVFKRFITLHGLHILSMLLSSEALISPILAILDKIPLTLRNQIEETHLEEKLAQINSPKALELLKKWSRLDAVFRIPKADAVAVREKTVTSGYLLDQYQSHIRSKWKRNQDARAKSPDYPSSSAFPLSPTKKENRGSAKNPIRATNDDKIYYYSPTSSEAKRSDLASAKNNETSLSRVESIIARAKAAAFERESAAKRAKETFSSSSTSSLSCVAAAAMPKVKDEIGQVVVRYLSRYKNEISTGFKDLARKLTHALADKEMARSMPFSFEMTKSKRAKIHQYLEQYLQSHGYTTNK